MNFDTRVFEANDMKRHAEEHQLCGLGPCTGCGEFARAGGDDFCSMEMFFAPWNFPVIDRVFC